MRAGAGYDVVARATTLPILLLGGESAGDPTPFLEELGSAMKAGPNVRGALVGRNVIFPGDDDPAVIAQAIKHPGFSFVEVLSTCPTNWGMTPVSSLKFVEEHMIPAYPLGDYKISDAIKQIKI